jgi:hypothetical protein
VVVLAQPFLVLTSARSDAREQDMIQSFHQVGLPRNHVGHKIRYELPPALGDQFKRSLAINNSLRMRSHFRKSSSERAMRRRAIRSKYSRLFCRESAASVLKTLCFVLPIQQITHCKTLQVSVAFAVVEQALEEF